MITGYQIRTMENNEEVLLLYIQMEEEFSLEWFEKLKTTGFQEFIRKSRIFWNGTRVFLVVGGITLAVLHYNPVKTEEVKYISDTLFTPLISEKMEYHLPKGEVQKDYGVQENSTVQETIERPSDSSSNSNRNPLQSSTSSTNTSSSQEEVADQTMYVVVYRKSGAVVRLTMEAYLIGVVAAEMPASFHPEALKAQSILARTYALKKIQSGEKLTDTVSTQAYIDTDQMKKQWGSSYASYYQKIENAVLSTKNLVITYQGILIDAVYHSTSNGATEDSGNVWGNSFPYLKSVDSKWDLSATSYLRSIQLSKTEFSRIFGLSTDSYSVEILERNESGRVTSIKVGDTVYTGIKFRELLSLRSTDFDLSFDDDVVTITTRGYGHGVGLSQYGANGMAKEGYSANNILKHYYSGVEIIAR